MKSEVYPYIEYPFEEFNPVQECVLPEVENDSNLVVAAPTSSGKTICGELIAGKVLDTGDSVVYLSPLKALAEEKFADWSNEHTWEDYSKILLTGDYKMTDRRKRELIAADIILATYEMLSVRCRNYHFEKISWIGKVGCLIVDEAHFIGSKGRGDHLENALITFTRINPQARIVCLSATLTNCKEIAEWVTKITGRNTELIEKTWRPVELSVHTVPYDSDCYGQYLPYHEKETLKCDTALALIEEHSDDQWLIFVHGKPTGRKIKKMIEQEFSDPVAFHSADLDRDKRAKIEAHFKEGRIKYLVATSTLAYGVNLPARRVCVVGIERGQNTVDPLDVIQECGRAGRPTYDTHGDAYVVLASRQRDYWTYLLANGIKVTSCLADSIGFHLIGEITSNHVNQVEEAEDWISKTLLSHQKHILTTSIESIFIEYEENKLIRQSGWGDEKLYEVTKLGCIASMNYFDPMDVVKWHKNLLRVSISNLWYKDAVIAWMIACVPSTAKKYFLTQEMRPFVAEWILEIRPFDLRSMGDGASFLGTVIWQLLKGEELPDQAYSIKAAFFSDVERIINCLNQIQQRVMSTGSDEIGSDYWMKLALRCKYQVGWAQAELCLLKGIGKAYSERLIEEGIESIEQFYTKRREVRRILPTEIFKKALISACDILDKPIPKRKKVSSS